MGSTWRKVAAPGGSMVSVTLSCLLGAGVQYKINQNNAFNIGMSYQRGLINVARTNELTSKNRVVSLDLGFKF